MTTTIIIFYFVLLLFSLAYLLTPLFKSPDVHFWSSQEKDGNKQDLQSSELDTNSTKREKAKPKTTMFKSLWLPFLLLINFVFISKPLFATDVQVQIKNLSTQKPARSVEAVKLLELSQSMKVLQEEKNINKEISFEQADMQENTPYMVQVVYRGTVYSYPFQKKAGETAKIEAQVYDVNNHFSKDLDYRKVIYISYLPDGLLFRNITVFENNSNKVFSEKEGGVYISAPDKILNVQAMVPMGGKGGSQLNWLNLQATPSTLKKGMYLLPQSVKPGFKFYQTDFLLEYNGEKILLPLREEYPSEQKVIVKLDVKGMDVRIQEDSDWRPQILDSEEFGKHFELPARKTLTFVLSGGEISEPPESDNSPVRVDSPLTKIQKAAIIIFSLLLIFAVFFYVSTFKSTTNENTKNNSDENEIVMQLKERNQLVQSLKELQADNAPTEEKQEQTQQLQERIWVLEEKINSHGLS